MAVSIVQVVKQRGINGVQNVVIAAPSASNAIFITVGVESGSTSFAASDTINGSYTKDVAAGPFTGLDDIAIFSKRNISAGFTTVTITPTNLSAAYDYVIYEVSGLGSTGTPGSDSYTDFSGVNTAHFLGATGVNGSGFALGVSTFTTSRNPTALSGWTKQDGTGSNGTVHMSKVSTSFANDKGPFSLNAVAGTSGIMAIYSEVTVSSTLSWTPQVQAQRGKITVVSYGNMTD